VSRKKISPTKKLRGLGRGGNHGANFWSHRDEAILTAGHRPSTPSEQLADLKQYSEQKIIFMNRISGKKRN
jgi:hypothetical protein